MKTSIVAATLALLVGTSMTLAAPAPSLRTEDSLTLAPGQVLVGQVVDGTFRLAALTQQEADLLLSGAVAGLGVGVKACENDVKGEGAYHWASVSTVPPTDVGGTNTASEGECADETHSGPVSFMQFRTAGDYYGIAHAEGCSASRCGGYQVYCHPVGAATGYADHEGWGTLQRGRDTTCTWASYGPQPHEWVEWNAWVGNSHYWEGTVSALFV